MRDPLEAALRAERRLPLRLIDGRPRIAITHGVIPALGGDAPVQWLAADLLGRPHRPSIQTHRSGRPRPADVRNGPDDSASGGERPCFFCASAVEARGRALSIDNEYPTDEGARLVAPRAHLCALDVVDVATHEAWLEVSARELRAISARGYLPDAGVNGAGFDPAGGPSATGATIAHLHGHIVACGPDSLPTWLGLHRVARRYRRETGRLLLPDAIEALHAADLIIARRGEAVLAASPTPSLAGELLILRPGGQDLAGLPDDALADLAALRHRAWHVVSTVQGVAGLTESWWPIARGTAGAGVAFACVPRPSSRQAWLEMGGRPIVSLKPATVAADARRADAG